MTVKELIETLKTCDEKSEVKVEQLKIKFGKVLDLFFNGLNMAKEVNSINANGLYVIRKAGSNRAGFIKFND